MLEFSYDAIGSTSNAAARRESYALYVVDADLALVLAGTTPADLAPVEAPLPRDVSASLAIVLHEHNFDRETIACIATPQGRQLRATRIRSIGRPYYAVVVERRLDTPAR